MAGRYHGYHLFSDEEGKDPVSVEVFWQREGWFWRRRFEGHPPDGGAVGPFTTSSGAFRDAKTSPRRATDSFKKGRSIQAG